MIPDLEKSLFQLANCLVTFIPTRYNVEYPSIKLFLSETILYSVHFNKIFGIYGKNYF